MNHIEISKFIYFSLITLALTGGGYFFVCFRQFMTLIIVHITKIRIFEIIGLTFLKV